MTIAAPAYCWDCPATSEERPLGIVPAGWVRIEVNGGQSYRCPRCQAQRPPVRAVA